MTYEEFLEKKQIAAVSCGFEKPKHDMCGMLFEWQKDIVYWTLKKGRAAIFADCGLGKTPMQLQWADAVAEHTEKPVLIVCPLAVAEQTKREGEKFGFKAVHVVRDRDQVRNGINVTNYEMLGHFDADVFGGVVLDECFYPETRISVLSDDGGKAEKRIEDVKPGDVILNCTGKDKVVAVKRKKVPYGIQVGFNGRTIICSPRHPFFTQRGWVCARELKESDFIVSTEKAVRILRGDFSGSKTAGVQETVLQHILLCEMENVPTGDCGESALAGGARDNREKTFDLAQNNRCRAEGSGSHPQPKSDEGPGDKSKSLCEIEGDAPRTFKAWGKWNRDDVATAVNDGCIARELDCGITYLTGQETARLPDELQGRLRKLGHENCDRVGWELSPFEKRSRQEEGRKTGFFRVESFKVLEPGCSELDGCRDANGSLYFIDIEIARHPSFTVNGCLVHNSSILKNYSGKMRTEIIDMFLRTPYKLSCTATPAPNDYMELGNQAEFCGVMSRTEMLATYFIHDGGETSKWRLKGHGADRFWEWLATWAVVMQKPSDLGYDDEGFSLPPLHTEQHVVKSDENIVDDNFSLFAGVAHTLNERRNARRNSLESRCEEAARLIAGAPDEQWLVWCDLNAEADELKRIIPDAIEVRGTDTPEYKAYNLNGFTVGTVRRLISKPSIAGFGLNWQNCHNMIFVGLSDSYEMMYQAIRRCWRFGQEHDVNVHIITSEAEGAVKDNIDRKERQATFMIGEMVKHTKEILEEEIRGTVRQTTPYNPQMEMVIPEWLVSA